MKSILEYPVIVLHLMFDSVREYNAESTRQPATYEHVWAGFIYTVLAVLFATLSLWVLVAIPAMYFVHVILKEVILDKKKRMAKQEPIRSRDFKAQLIERSAGFVIGLPFGLILLF